MSRYGASMTNNTKDLEEAIMQLYSCIDDINCCHGCLFNCEYSKDIISSMNKVADLINLDSKLRWWNKYND
jgi:hypothetical protein